MAKEKYVSPAITPEFSLGLTRFLALRNPKFVSPTDKMLTPVSQKLNAVKKKHFDKCVALFLIRSVLLLNKNP